MNRSVGFIDVLGFRQLVESTSAGELGEKFVRVVDLVQGFLKRPPLPGKELPRLFPEHAPDAPWCISHVFSDSIILISSTGSRNDCLKLLVFALRAMQTLIAHGFPVRGAVAYGDLFVDLQRRLFLGPALTRAYELEQRQDWIGGAVDPGVERAFPDLFSAGEHLATVEALFPCYQVPFKSGEVREYRTLNWRWNLVVERGTRSLFGSPSDWADHRKVLNALEYALHVRSRGLAYPAQPDKVPVEVQSYFVGDGPPPPKFGHGDEL